MNEFIVPRLEKLDSQPEVQALLAGLLKAGTVKTFLWTGPLGSGKKTHALALVRTLFCQGGPDCAGCIPCRQVLGKTHPDFFWIQKGFFWNEKKDEGKSRVIPIDVVRKLLEKLYQAPLSAPLKVAIIPNADTMTPEAQEAFLKTLEEPPRKSLILLLSEKKEDFLPTVLSRCRPVRFGPLSTAKVECLLSQVYGWNAAKANQAAENCDGNLSLALKFADEIWVAFTKKVRTDFDGALEGNEGVWLRLGTEYDKMEPDFLEEELTASQRKAEVLRLALQTYLSIWSRRLAAREPIPPKLDVLAPSQVLRCLRMHLDLIPSHVPPKMILDHLFLNLRRGLETGEVSNESFTQLAVEI